MLTDSSPDLLPLGLGWKSTEVRVFVDGVHGAELPNCPQVASRIAGHVQLGKLRPCPAMSRSSGHRLPQHATTIRAQASLTYLRR